MQRLQLGLFFALLGCAFAVHAGWVETDKDGGTTLVADGRMKTIDQDGNYFVADSQRGTIMFVDVKGKTYAVSTADELCAATVASMRELLQNAPPEQREGMEQMLKRDKSNAPQAKVSIVKVGPGGRVAGYDTTIYKVMLNGELYERVWIASAAVFKRELEKMNIGAMNHIFRCMSPFEEDAGVENTEEYRGLLKTGWPLKSESVQEGSIYIHEASQLVEKNIPEVEFAPPANFRKIPIRDFIKAQ